MEKLVILGAGCAGYTAAIYAGRADLEPLIISGNEVGGQLTLTTTVENFPGFPNGVDGNKLVEDMKAQALKFGAKFKQANATNFNVLKDGFEIELDNKEKIKAATVIIATGASARWLGIPSEQKYKGRGVHTCATCDGFFYKNKEVLVIGGGDSACEDALTLSKFANKVTIVHRRDALRASMIMQDRVKANPKVEIIWNSAVEEVKGDKFVTSVILKDVNTGKTKEVKTDGIFLAIGHVPNTNIFKGKVKMDDNGFIMTDRRMATDVPGVFAAGDVQDTRFKQAITASASGCQAAMEAERYYEEMQHKK